MTDVQELLSHGQAGWRTTIGDQPKWFSADETNSAQYAQCIIESNSFDPGNKVWYRDEQGCLVIITNITALSPGDRARR